MLNKLSFWKTKDDIDHIDMTKEEKHCRSLLSTITHSAREITLEKKEIYIMPPEIGHFIHLTALNLSHNKLKVLPLELFKCTQLETLDLSDNELLEIPQEIKLLNKLEILLLSSNHIPRIPDGLYEIDSLVTLFLNDNNILSISRKIVHMKNLARLNLSQNRLTKIPHEIILLDELKSVMLQGNDIKEAPVELLSISLDIKSTLSPLLLSPRISIKDNTQCGVLNLSNMKLNNIGFSDPDNALKISAVDLSGNLLNSFPTQLLIMENLISLSLANNKLLKLNGISKMALLTNLDISGNRLEEFPREILSLKGMKSLKIEKNPYQAPLPKVPMDLDSESMTSWAIWDKRIKRRQVFDELIHTEHNYLIEIRKLNNYWMQFEKVTTKDDSLGVFTRLHNILTVNEAFYRDMQKMSFEHMEDDAFDLGLLFSEYASQFIIYADYINDYAGEFRRVKIEIEKNKKFKEFWMRIPEFQSKSDIPKALSTYCIMPIQRIPRYLLILTEMKKNTPVDHPLYDSLLKGLTAIMEMAEYCNSKKTEREFMDRVGDIAQDLSDHTIVKSDRIFLYEITSCKRIIGEKKRRRAKIYLFNDMVIIMEDKVYKMMNHHIVIERIRDYYNRLSITTTGNEFVIEFDSLMSLEEFFQLWIEENHKFWMEYYSQNYFESINDTQLTTKMKGISNMRYTSIAINKRNSTVLPMLALENLGKNIEKQENKEESDAKSSQSSGGNSPSGDVEVRNRSLNSDAPNKRHSASILLQNLQQGLESLLGKRNSMSMQFGLIESKSSPRSPHVNPVRSGYGLVDSTVSTIPVVDSKPPVVTAIIGNSKFSPPGSPRIAQVSSPGRHLLPKESVSSGTKTPPIIGTSKTSLHVQKLIKMKRGSSIITGEPEPKSPENTSRDVTVNSSREHSGNNTPEIGSLDKAELLNETVGNDINE